MNEIRRERAAVVATDGLRRISWGAIIAGALLALAIQFMLGLLGLGIGLATLDPTGAESFDPNTFASVSGLWTVAVVLIGLFVGAYAAGRLAGSSSKTDAILHGVVTWATSTLLVVFLLTSGASAVLGTAFGAIGGSIQGLAQASSAMSPDTMSDRSLNRAVEEALRPRAGAVSPATIEPAGEGEGLPAAAEPAPVAPVASDGATMVATVLAGLGEQATADQRQAASRAIAQQAGVPLAEAEQRLQQFQQTYDSAKREARVAADATARAVAAASFAAFVALALGLIVGALGGLLGRPRGSHIAGRV